MSLMSLSLCVAVLAGLTAWLSTRKTNEFVFDGKLEKIKLTPYDHQSDEQFHYENNWRPQKGDILCLTYPKTGQTLLLHMMNQIRSKGECRQSLLSAAFWPTRAWNFKQDLNEPQIYEPRLFKSHNPLPVYSEEFGAKYITIVREPTDVLYSLHYFLIALGVTDLQIDDFADAFFFSPESNIMSNMFQFYADFWKVHERDDILILCFEDLIQNKRKHINILQSFMGVELLESFTVDAILNVTSKEFMYENLHLFNGEVELFLAKENGRPLNFKPAPVVTKRDKRIQASEDTLQKLTEWWTNIVTAQTGFTNYSSFRIAVNGLL